MQTSRIRLATISAATLALVVAGSATVTAHPGDRDDALGFGPSGMDGYGGRDMLRGHVRGMLGWALDGFVRTETTYQTDDGLVTQRVDSGTVTGTSEAAVDYALPSGETATASTDEDTYIIALGEETFEIGLRGFRRERLVPESIELADIAAGNEVVVWAVSQDDGTFLAQRVIVQPAADVAEDEAAADDEAVADEGAETEPVAEASPASDA